MKLPIVAGLCILFAMVIAYFPKERNAQEPLRPKILAPQVYGDFELVRTPSKMYRFDKRTGTTQYLNIRSENIGIKYSWVSVKESVTPPNVIEENRYDVCEGTQDSGILVRIDRKSGKTWSMAIINNDPVWQLIVQ